MSLYVPRLQSLRVINLKDGWWIVDDHGPYEGPYETMADAAAVISDWHAAENQESAR